MAPKIYSRFEIGLKAPTRSPIVIPASGRRGLVGHHNGPDMNLDWQNWSNSRLLDRELALVRGIQRYHMNNLGWSDSAYSWFLGQSGNLYECRGEAWDQFANGTDVVGEDDGTDRVWYTVMCMIGWNDNRANPVDEEPSPAMLESFQWLVGHVRDLGADNRVLPHNDFKVKRCPGVTISQECDRLDRSPVTGGGASMASPMDDWRKQWNSADPAVANGVVEMVQRFLKTAAVGPDGQLKRYYGFAVDGLKGGISIEALKAWKRDSLGANNPGPNINEGVWAAILTQLYDVQVQAPGDDCSQLEAELSVCELDLGVTKAERDAFGEEALSLRATVTDIATLANGAL